VKDSWSQLPIDVLDNIIKRLELPVDAVSFSGVCKPWRYVASAAHMSPHCKLPMHHLVPKRSPLPMLLHPGCEGPNTHQLYSLNEQMMYGGFHLQELSNKWIVGSGAGWLVTVDTVDTEVNLLNPLTRKKIPLPHSSTLPLFQIPVYPGNPTDFWYFRKVIVGYYRGSFLVVALVSDVSAIRFCRVGDSKWTRLENTPLTIDDIIIHNGKLYAINRWSDLFEIDVADPAKVKLVAVPGSRPTGSKCFLVDLCGELVLLSRIISKKRRKRSVSMTSQFEVYKLAEDENGHFEEYMSESGMQYHKGGHSWAQLDNLGHHMVFIGFNHSVSLDSRVYPRCEGNCIYFADRRQDEYDNVRMRGICKKIFHDVGIYHMNDQKVKYLENFCGASSPMNMVWLSPNFSTELDMQMLPQ
jgi:Protein of unknown function (DUF295)/F-box domain